MERKGPARGEMEEKRNAGRKRKKDARGKKKGRVKGLSVCESVGVGPDWARVYAFLQRRNRRNEKEREQKTGERGRERKYTDRTQDKRRRG